MNKLRNLLVPVLICFAVGFVASRIQADALTNWYPYLNKSSLNPPNIVFPIAWSILYLCMGLSIGLIIDSGHPRRKFFVWLFAIQLLFNFAWSVIFFYFKNPGGALITIVTLEFLIVCYTLKAWPLNRLSSYLFFPYIAWVAFAAYLNLYIVLNN